MALVAQDIIWGNEVGRGGHAIIRAAMLVTDGTRRLVAAKIFNRIELADGEVRAMQRLSRIPGSDQYCMTMITPLTNPAHGYVGYLMPFMELGTLGELARKTPDDPSRVLELSVFVRKALLFLSENGLVHGDVKEDNALLDSQRGVVLSDLDAVSIGEYRKLGATYPPFSLVTSSGQGVSKVMMLDYRSHVDDWGFTLMIARFMGLSSMSDFAYSIPPNELKLCTATLAGKLIENWSWLKSLDVSIKEVVLKSINAELDFLRQPLIRVVPYSGGSLGLSVDVDGTSVNVTGVQSASILKNMVKVGDGEGVLKRIVLEDSNGGFTTLYDHIMSVSKEQGSPVAPGPETPLSRDGVPPAGTDTESSELNKLLDNLLIVPPSDVNDATPTMLVEKIMNDWDSIDQNSLRDKLDQLNEHLATRELPKLKLMDGSGKLGMTISDVDGKVKVTGINAGSLAESNGIKVGDSDRELSVILLIIDNHPVRLSEYLSNRIKGV